MVKGGYSLCEHKDASQSVFCCRLENVSNHLHYDIMGVINLTFHASRFLAKNCFMKPEITSVSRFLAKNRETLVISGFIKQFFYTFSAENVFLT